jgi:hypothetical protein
MIRPFLDHFSLISRSFLSHSFRQCRACFIICHTQHNNNAAPTLTMSRLFFLPYPHFVSLRMIRPFLAHFPIISRSFLSHSFSPVPSIMFYHLSHCRASCFINCHTQHNNNAAPSFCVTANDSTISRSFPDHFCHIFFAIAEHHVLSFVMPSMLYQLPCRINCHTLIFV